MKLDVEGAEVEILETARSSTLRRIRKLTLEFHGETRKARVLGALERAGFKLKRINTEPHYRECLGIIQLNGTSSEPWFSPAAEGCH